MEMKYQFIGLISTRFFALLLIIILSFYLLMTNKLTPDMYANIVVISYAIYVGGRSITHAFELKNKNNGGK
ncbi:MAG: hypothetical protein QW228_03300 [Candidatus Aenigmatarchaeota archaeon]